MYSNVSIYLSSAGQYDKRWDIRKMWWIMFCFVEKDWWTGTGWCVLGA